MLARRGLKSHSLRWKLMPHVVKALATVRSSFQFAACHQPLLQTLALEVIVQALIKLRPSADSLILDSKPFSRWGIELAFNLQEVVDWFAINIEMRGCLSLVAACNVTQIIEHSFLLLYLDPLVWRPRRTCWSHSCNCIFVCWCLWRIHFTLNNYWYVATLLVHIYSILYITTTTINNQIKTNIAVDA